MPVSHVAMRFFARAELLFARRPWEGVLIKVSGTRQNAHVLAGSAKTPYIVSFPCRLGRAQEHRDTSPACLVCPALPCANFPTTLPRTVGGGRKCHNDWTAPTKTAVNQAQPPPNAPVSCAGTFRAVGFLWASLSFYVADIFLYVLSSISSLPWLGGFGLVVRNA